MEATELLKLEDGKKLYDRIQNINRFLVDLRKTNEIKFTLPKVVGGASLTVTGDDEFILQMITTLEEKATALQEEFDAL
jgi:hypothetical protein